MEVIKSVQEMADISTGERARGKSIRLVPTMGALHEGHVSLMQTALRARKESSLGQGGDKDAVVIVSIFVNPLQFNNADDFTCYPNTLEADLSMCRALGVNYIFAPSVDEMYPDKCQSSAERCMVHPADHLADTLEGKSRPGHFKGMLTVVCKLFNITKPDEAYFGEKDYQQLLLVAQMSRDLNMGVRIIPVETVREPDRLPLSSRNVRLSYSQRRTASLMCRILIDAKRALENRLPDKLVTLDSVLAASTVVTIGLVQGVDETSSFTVDYLQLRCSKDLCKINYNEELCGYDCLRGCVAQQVRCGADKAFKARLLTSVVVGDVRLLDNIEIVLNTSTN